MVVATEGIQADRRLLDLQHRLTVDSFLMVMPQLLATDADAGGSAEMTQRTMQFGKCSVRAEVRPESRKKNVRSAADLNGLAAELRALAQSAGLRRENVQLLPIVEPDRQKLGTFSWFDQLLEQDEFEEVFRWRFRPADQAQPLSKCWSDLVTFWGAGTSRLLAIEMETVVGQDSRRWYVVAGLEGSGIKVFHKDRM
jgi:hypothetical protein